MDILSDDPSELIFKRRLRNGADDIRLSGQMLKVFVEIDGVKNLKALADAVGMPPENLKRVLARLCDLRLIEKESPAQLFLDDGFFDFLGAQLALAVGPIAPFMIEDEIRDFSGKSGKVPCRRAAELVDRLSRQIQRPEKKIAFQQALVNKIRELTG